jgi:pimeloyl-ACP methyl ester carboxylesterase
MSVTPFRVHVSQHTLDDLQDPARAHALGGRDRDISKPPREWAERFFNVQRWTEMPRGGHFAAMEEPELLVNDIRAFFRPLRAGLAAPKSAAALA